MANANDNQQNSEVTTVEAPPAKTSGTEVELDTTTKRTADVSFRPSRRALGQSREVFGSMALQESSVGAVENLDGTRVQHTHDRALYRLMEELLIEIRNLRNQEKGDL